MSSFHSLKQIKVLDRSPQGEGAFSKVFKVQHREDNKIYALKQIDILQLSKADCDNLKLEIQLHKRLKHDNIIGFKGCLQRKNLVYMLLEQAANGSLFFYIDLNEGLPELLALRFLYETAKGIENLHQNRIVHRDIKPENILLDNNFQVKVCDFGWSCKIEDQEVSPKLINNQRSSICGTYEYMSPEIVYEQSHNFGVDVWCLGILLYEMLHGSPPFKAESLKQIKKEFKNRKIKISKNFDKDTQSLINQLLQYDSRKRITVSQLLKHRAIVKNLRHFHRKLTQEEYNLMRKYYYMNAGGVNLDCHNSVYAQQLTRQSQLSRVDDHEMDGFVNLNISQDLGDEVAGLHFPSPKNGEQGAKRGNDFQPAKFMTPYGKEENKKGNLNQFQPNNFLGKNQVSPLQDHPQMAANAFKRKKTTENGDINQYNPPTFMNKPGDTKLKNDNQGKSGNESRQKRGKSERIIKYDKPVTQRKNSSLKQKLRVQKMKQSNANINNFNPTENYGKQSIRERGRAKHQPTSFARQITDLKNPKQLIERRKQAALNRSRQEPKSNRVIRSASSNPALLSHSTTRFGSRNLQEKRINNTNHRKMPNTLSKNKHTKSQTANLWSRSRSGRKITQGSGNPARHADNNQIKRSEERERVSKRKIHHREDSVSVERLLASRVIKNSSSLPKKLFGLNKSQGKSNFNTRRDKHKLKTNQRVLNLVKPGNALFNRKFGSRDDKNVRNFKSGIRINYNNNTSINYKADEVIKEEKYLSDFQNVKSNIIKKTFENNPNPKAPITRKIEPEIRQITHNQNLKLPSQTDSKISKSIRSPMNESKTTISSQIKKTQLTNPKINISMMSKDNITSRQAIPSQNSILMDRNYVSSVSFSTSFLNTTQFGQGVGTHTDKNYASVSNYLSNQELKKSPIIKKKDEGVGPNFLAGLEGQERRNSGGQRSGPNAERTGTEIGNLDMDVPTKHEERFVKTTGSTDLRTHLQQAREELRADQKPGMVKGKSMFLNYDFDSKEHNKTFDGLRHSDLEPRPNVTNLKTMQSSQSSTALRSGVQVIRKKAFQNFSKDKKVEPTIERTQERQSEGMDLQISQGQTGNLSKINEEDYSLEMTRTIEDRHRKKDFAILTGGVRSEIQQAQITRSKTPEKQTQIKRAERSRSRRVLPAPRKSENTRNKSDMQGKHKRNHSMVKRTVIINGVKTERLILSKNHQQLGTNEPQTDNNAPHPPEAPRNIVRSNNISITKSQMKNPITKEIKVKSANRANDKTDQEQSTSKWVETNQKSVLKFGESRGQIRRILKANRSQKVLRKVQANDSPVRNRNAHQHSAIDPPVNESGVKRDNHYEDSLSRTYKTKKIHLSDLERAKKRISSVNATSIGQALSFRISKKDDIKSLINKVQKIEPTTKVETRKVELNRTPQKVQKESQNENKEPGRRRFTNYDGHLGVMDYQNLGNAGSTQHHFSKNIKYNFSNSNPIELADRLQNPQMGNETPNPKITTNPPEILSNFQSLRSPKKVEILNDEIPEYFPNQSNQGPNSQKRVYNAVRFEDSFSFPQWEKNIGERGNNEDASGSVLKGLNSIHDTPQSKSNFTSRRTTQNSNFYKKEDANFIGKSNFEMSNPGQGKEMVQSNLLEGKAQKHVNVDQSARTEKKISEKSIQTAGGRKKLYQKKNMAMLIKGEYQASNRFNRWTNYQFSKRKGKTNILSSPQVITSKKNIDPNLTSKDVNSRSHQRGRLTERSTRNPHLSVNIRQLPGLKESISMDKLTTKRQLNQIKKSPSTRKIQHHKNMSMDVSKIHQRAQQMEGFSTRGRSKRLEKTVDGQGVIRYKLVSKENSPVREEKEIERKISIRRSEVRVTKSQIGRKEIQREPKRSERLERDSDLKRSQRVGRSITSRLKILNRRKVTKKSEQERHRSNRSNSRVVVRRIRRKGS